MTLAIIEIKGRLAARIDSDGNVEILEQSARLAELVAEFNLLKTMPGLIGMTRVASAAVAMTESAPEFRLAVRERDLIIGDVAGFKLQP